MEGKFSSAWPKPGKLAGSMSAGSNAGMRPRLWRVGAAWLGIVVVLAAVEWLSGRSPLGPDGRFGWWESSIWSSENSQRVADAYSFSHILHGILFYGALHWLLPRVPVRHRLLIATAVEAGWELLENSPWIIHRYREATIALGYDGDSVLNSCSDVAMATLGFLLAWRLRPRTCVILFVVFELGCLAWVRDNLTLNVLMLAHPVEAIKRWQEAGRPR
jgi:hypothetical protein